MDQNQRNACCENWKTMEIKLSDIDNWAKSGKAAD